MAAKKFILIVTGNPASGKDSYAQHFTETYGGRKVGMSSLINDYAAEHGIQLKDRRSFQTAHRQMRAEKGMYALPQTVLEFPEEVICVSGLRVPAYQKYLHKIGAQTLALWGSIQTRYKYAINDIGRPSVDIQKFWHDERTEYFSKDPFDIATVTVMSNAQHNVSIDEKDLSEVAHEADRIIVPELHLHLASIGQQR